MPSTRPVRLAVLAALVVVVTTAACDSTSSPSTVPSATSSAPATVCEDADREASGIEGRVVDSEGNPLNDIVVILEVGSFVGEARTGDDGEFHTSGVTGEIAISTVDIDYQEATRRVTVACGETVDVELVLTPVGG